MTTTDIDRPGPAATGHTDDPLTWVRHISLDHETSLELHRGLKHETSIDRSSIDGPDPLTPPLRRLLHQHLADPLAAELRSLRHPLGPPAVVIDGLPLADACGPTPTVGQPTDDRLPAAKAMVTWLAETMGVFLLGYPTIAGGRVFHDVNPVKNTKRPLSSKGADLELPLHCDSASNEDRPNYLVLWALRSSPNERVATRYAEITAALQLLDEATVAILREPRFQLLVATIVDPGPGDPDRSEPVALVSGPAHAPELRLHATRTEALDPEAALALEALVSALNRVGVDIELTPGRMLIINNRRGVHGRNAFTPTYDGSDRWLLRSYLLSDPWHHREAIEADRILVPAPVVGS